MPEDMLIDREFAEAFQDDPRVEDLLDQLQRTPWFSRADLRSSCHNLRARSDFADEITLAYVIVTVSLW